MRQSPAVPLNIDFQLLAAQLLKTLALYRTAVESTYAATTGTAVDVVYYLSSTSPPLVVSV